MMNVDDGKDTSVTPRKSKAASKRKFRAQREPMDHIAVRLPAKDVARIDALAVKYTTTWLKPSRSDMVRKLLLKALAAEDAEVGEEPTDDESAV
jgi:hypothetical protein